MVSRAVQPFRLAVSDGASGGFLDPTTFFWIQIPSLFGGEDGDEAGPVPAGGVFSPEGGKEGISGVHGIWTFSPTGTGWLVSRLGFILAIALWLVMQDFARFSQVSLSFDV